MKKKCWIAASFLVLLGSSSSSEDLGQLSANPYAPNSTANPYSPAGSRYSSTSVRNPNGAYGSPYSNQSATNPYATDAPKLYDADGNYRGKLSANPYDPDSVSNPYGRYGSKYSADSINNPYGAGNPYKSDSPSNPYGDGWKIKSDDASMATVPKYPLRAPSSSRSVSGYRAPTYSTRPSAQSPWSSIGADEPEEDDLSADPGE